MCVCVSLSPSSVHIVTGAFAQEFSCLWHKSLVPGPARPRDRCPRAHIRCLASVLGLLGSAMLISMVFRDWLPDVARETSAVQSGRFEKLSCQRASSTFP